MIKTIEQNLLQNNDLDIQFLLKINESIMQKNVDLSDLYLQSMYNEYFGIDEGIIKSGGFSLEQGIGARAICGEKVFLTYSNCLNPSIIKKMVDNIFIESGSHKGTNTTNITYDSKKLYTELSPINSADSVKKTDILKKIDLLARKLTYVTNVISNLTLEFDEVCIVSSKNGVIADLRPLIHLSITIVINKNGKIEKGSQGFGGRYLIDCITDSILEQYVMLAYNQAVLMVDAVTGPSGSMPVILGNAWAGVILHEAIGHGLEGDFNRRGSSAFTNRIGQKVASSGVTIVDEGCIPNCRGSLNVDDEGTPTQRTVLIEDGVLCGYLFDELNAKQMGVKSTGNGRRESFNCNPMPRMTNTYMLNGKYTHDEIIESVDEGVYAESFTGGQVDITSGQFVFNANVAWVIKKGKLAYPIKGCALVGNGPECLKYVSMIGNNSALDTGVGTCGKNGQSVPVGVGQPTIKIDGGLIVGGG